MFRRNLFKRFLPVVLSVAMLVGDLPVNALTAYAAENTSVVEEATDVGAPDGSVTDVPLVGTTDAVDVVPVTEVIVDRDELFSEVKDEYEDVISYNYVDNTLKTAYSPYQTMGMAKKIEEKVKTVVAFELNGEEADSATAAQLKNHLNFQWQKADAAGAYTDLADREMVEGAGKYQLVISLGAIENVCDAASDVTVKLEIEKADVQASLDPTVNVRPGMTVKDAKEAISAGLHYYIDAEPISVTDYVTAAPEIVIQDAHTKTPLADEFVLKSKEDYFMVINAAMKDLCAPNFKFEDNVIPLVLSDGYSTEVEITYADPGARIAVTYGDTAVFGQTDGLANKVKSAFTAKVTYTKDNETEKTELAGAAIQYEWYDANGVLLLNAPVDAGTYTYRAYFEDENGNYQSSYSDVTVSIDMAKIVVAPATYDGGDVYVGDSTSDILKNVKYEAFDVTNGVVSAAPNAAYHGSFWGYAYNVDVAIGTTQIYEPVIRVQRKSDKGSWTDYSGLIQEGYSYRLIFSGKKAVYTADRTEINPININSAQKNYTVDTSKTTLEQYARALNVKATSGVVIKVDDILVNGAGASLENPLTQTYTGKGWYEAGGNKGAYKKASAVTTEGSTIATGTDANLTYTWQQLTYSLTSLLDDDKNVKIPQKPTETSTQKEKDLWYNWEESWEDCDYTFTDYLWSPDETGVYRLKIAYKDANHKYGSAVNYVYYVIKPQDAVVTLTGAPSVYADGVTTVEDFLATLRTYVKEGESAETLTNYLQTVINPVTGLTEVGDGTATPVKGTEELVIYDGLHTVIQKMDMDPLDYFMVERKIKDGVNAGKWTRANAEETFEAGTEYRLTADHNAFVDNYDYRNYNFGCKIGALGQIQKYDYYMSDTVAVTVKETQGAPVRITVDESQIKNHTKVYDGKPFDLTELKSLIKVQTVNGDGSLGADVTASVTPEIMFAYTEDERILRRYQAEVTYLSADTTLHAGVYYPYIYTATNDSYRGAYKSLETAFIIKPREATLVPVFAEKIYAGYCSISNIVPNYEFKVEGLAAGDEDAVEWVDWRVYAEDQNTPLSSNDMLHSGETYYVKAYDVQTKSSVITAYDEYGLPAYRNDEYGVPVGRMEVTMNYDRDYEWQESITPFTPVRKAVTIEQRGTAFTDQTVVSETGEYTHTIKPAAGIGYLSGLTDQVTGDVLDRSSYFRIRLCAPVEFIDIAKKSFLVDGAYIYKKKISETGAHITDIQDSYIDVSFDAKADTKKYEFDILWSADYVEHFVVDLTSASVLADLTEAVAPKSLKFNGVVTKMTVGSSQQLDVKLTKSQMADVILLGYSVDNPQVLEIGENGYVTAMSKGTATVSVYPCKLDAEGNKVALEGKGVKKAVAKITVSDVSAPKLSGLTAKDTYVNITYTKPADGIRREVYILEGKAKPADFENKIQEVKNGDFSAFAYAEFLSASREVNTEQNGVVGAKGFLKVGGALEPNTQYTLYLRNVAGVRTVNGTEVAASAAGSVKNFKTIKPQETGIMLLLDEPAQEDYNAYADYSAGNADLVGSALGYFYKVKLTDKTVTLKTGARFLERYDASKSYADAPDYTWRDLPLAKDLAKTYMVPKMAYLVSDNRYRAGDVTYEDAKSKGYVLFDGYYYEKTSKAAAVDAKGKITLKSKGKVFVLAYDANTVRDAAVMNATYGDVAELYIYASPDSVTANAASIKLYPGQTIADPESDYFGSPVLLSDFLAYKEKAIALPGYEAKYADITVAETSDDFELNKGYLSFGNSYGITAKSAGKSITLHVTDAEVAKNGGSPATLNVTSIELPAVKSLKCTTAYDTSADITFQYPEYTFDFRVKLTDARGSVISDRLVRLVAQADSYNPKTKMWTYVTKVSSMTLLSQYNLSVTAVYGDEVSKEAKLKIKTIDIPAWIGSYTTQDKENNTAESGTGIGAPIFVMTNTSETYTSGTDSNKLNKVVLKSGNSYTLQALTNGSYAAARMTDSLTWKSSDTKVASVKAKAGTYTALLRTNKPGTAEISITSKLTKKVIGRWDVTVNAVGDAGVAGQYFDANEPYSSSSIKYGFDGMALSGIETVDVTLGTRLSTSLSRGQEQYYVFTAPALGKYAVTKTNISGMVKADGTTFSSGMLLQKGEQVLLYAQNKSSLRPVTVEIYFVGEMYAEAEVGKALTVKGGQTISFVADEDNYYTARYQNNTDVKAIPHEAVTVNKGATGIITFNSSVSPNKEYTVTIEKRVPQALESAGTTVSLKKFDSNDVEGTVKWVSFTAPEDNYYSFSFTTAKDNEVGARLYKKDSNLNSALQKGYNNFSNIFYNTDFTQVEDKKVLNPSELRLSKGTTVCWALMTNSETAEMTVSYTKREATALEAGKENPISIGEDSKPSRLYQFTAAEDGMYDFYLSDANKAFSSTSWHTSLVGSGDTLLSGLAMNSTVNGELELKAGQTIYLSFTSTAATAASPSTATLQISKRTATELKLGEANALTTTTTPGWYKVTIPETGVYTYRFTDVMKSGTASDIENYEIYFYDNMYDSEDYDNSVGNTESLAVAGQVVYLKICNDDAEKDKPVTAKLTISKQTIPAANKLTLAEDGAAVELKSESVAWYSFTAEEQNFYTFKVSNVAGAAKNMEAVIVYDSMLLDEESSTALPIGQERGWLLSKGETLYMMLMPSDGTSETQTAKANIRVMKRTVADKALELGENNVSVSKDKVAYYKFVADEDNRYTFTVSDVTAGNSMNLWWNSDLLAENGRWSHVSSGSQLGFEKGKTYYLKFVTTNADPATAKVKITKNVLTGTILKDSPTTLSLTNNDSVFYSFTALESGMYTFNATDTTKQFYYGFDNTLGEASAYNSGIIISNDLQMFGTRTMNAGETVYLTLKPTGIVNAENTANITIHVSQREGNVTALKLGDTNQIRVTEKNTIQWYSFTSYEENIYTFALKSVSGNLHVNFEEGDINGNYGSAKKLASVYLPDEAVDKENATVYIAVYATNVTSPVEATLSIIKREEAGQLQTGKANPITLNKDGSEVWYSFEAPEDGYYTLYALNGSSSMYMEEYESFLDEDYVADRSGLDIKMDERQMLKGDKIYYCFKASGSPSADVTADIYVTPRTLTGQLTTASATTVTLTQNVSNWYQFTAPTAGFYTISSSDATGYLQAKSYDELNDSEYTWFSSIGSNDVVLENHWMEADDSVYIMMFSNDATKGTPVTAKLSVTAGAEHKTLSAGVNTDIIELRDSAESYYVFTSTEGGEYRFMVSDGSNNLYAKDVLRESNIYVPSGSYEIFDVELGENESFVLGVRSIYASGESPVKATVTVQERVYDYKTVETVSFTSGSDSRVFEVTAPKYGSYIFTAKSDEYIDTVGTLFADADCTESIGYDDDSAGNGHFKLTHVMQEGETVYLKVRLWSSSAVDQSFRVRIYSQNYVLSPSINNSLQ